MKQQSERGNFCFFFFKIYFMYMVLNPNIHLNARKGHQIPSNIGWL